MKKRPETEAGPGLLAAGLLAVFFALIFILEVLRERPRWVVVRSFAGVTVCTAAFLFLLYQRWKNRK